MRAIKGLYWIFTFELLSIILLGCTTNLGNTPSAPNRKRQVQGILADQRNPEFAWKRFDALMVQKRYDEAIVCADELLARFPDYAKGYNNRGVAYWITKRHDKALADISEAISLDPDDVTLYKNRGYLQKEMGRYDEALHDLSHAIALCEDTAPRQNMEPDPFLYYERGWIYQSRKEYDQAIDDFDRAILLKSDMGNFYRDRGLAHYSKGQFDEAMSDLNRSIALDPQQAIPYLYRSYVYRMQGRYDQALEDENRGLELDPDNPFLLHERALTHWLKDMPEQAIADLEKSIRINPDNASAYFHSGYFMHERGRRDRAEALFKKSRELVPDILEESQESLIRICSSETDRFHEKARAAAELYLGSTAADDTGGTNRSPVLTKEEIDIRIFHVLAEPAKVEPGDEFQIKVKCRIIDTTEQADKVNLRFTYEIIQEEETIREKTNMLMIPKGKTVTLKSSLAAGNDPGTYKIRVILFYKDKITGQSTTLVVQ
jgi:tetratricopeptide (TPR) repeat protein